MKELDARLTTGTFRGALAGLWHNHTRHKHRLRTCGVCSEIARYGSREDVLLGRFFGLLHYYTAISIPPSR